MSIPPDARAIVLDCLSQTVGQPPQTLDLGLELSRLGVDSLSLLRLQIMLDEKLGLNVDLDIDVDDTTGESIIQIVQQEIGSGSVARSAL